MPRPKPTERPRPATPPSQPSRRLDSFPNPAPEPDDAIRFELPEFTCLCPLCPPCPVSARARVRAASSARD